MRAQYLDAAKSVIRLERDGSTLFIPVDPGNRDFQALHEQGVKVADPPAPEPAEVRAVTRRQARLALLEAGLLDVVEAAMADPRTPRDVRVTYEDATEWWRDDPVLAALAKTLGLSDEQIDALFRRAAEM